MSLMSCLIVASLIRRTLSPPLVSPGPQQTPSTHDGVPDNPGPSQLASQLPSQLPVSHPLSAKTTVDRGCDPISFSDDPEEDEATKGSHSFSRGRVHAHSAKSLSVRYERYHSIYIMGVFAI